jgi:hypothetical protein
VIRALLVAAVLVGLPIAALGVARSEVATPLPVTAAMRHHYFLVSERDCRRTLKKIEAQQGSGQLLGFRFAIDLGKYPKEFRAAVEAGCQAARG